VEPGNETPLDAFEGEGIEVQKDVGKEIENLGTKNRTDRGKGEGNCFRGARGWAAEPNSGQHGGKGDQRLQREAISWTYGRKNTLDQGG